MARHEWIALTVSALLLTGCAESPTAPDDAGDPGVAFSHAGGGGSTLDQSQPIVDTAAPFTYAVGSTSNQLLAQLFTTGVAGKLREVELPVACADGDLIIEIRDVAAGLPGSAVIASESFRPSTLTPFTPGVATFNVLPFRPAPRLAAGVQYALVASNPTGSCGMLPGPVGDPYAGGNAFFFDDVNGQWVNLSLGDGREDLPFFTYMK